MRLYLIDKAKVKNMLDVFPELIFGTQGRLWRQHTQNYLFVELLVEFYWNIFTKNNSWKVQKWANLKIYFGQHEYSSFLWKSVNPYL